MLRCTELNTGICYKGQTHCQKVSTTAREVHTQAYVCPGCCRGVSDGEGCRFLETKRDCDIPLCFMVFVIPPRWEHAPHTTHHAPHTTHHTPHTTHHTHAPGTGPVKEAFQISMNSCLELFPTLQAGDICTHGPPLNLLEHNRADTAGSGSVAPPDTESGGTA